MPPIKPISKICLIVNYNLYESKRYFTDKFAEALERKGLHTRIIDVQEGVLSADAMGSIVRFNPDLTCSFNTLLPVGDNRFLWDVINIPHWSILLDPALYSLNLTRSPYSMLSSVDKDDCANLLASGFNRAFFWPHAVERELIGSGETNKDLDVVFLGSCYDYESLRVSWQQQNSEAINKVLDDAIDLVFSDNHTSLSEALAKAWEAGRHSSQGVDFYSLFYYLDNYTRGRDRVELIRAIKDVPVHVYGSLSEDNAVGVLGWAPYLKGNKNVTVHPPLSFAEGLKVLRRAKISLNSTPFFKNGSHERVLTALACGALSITTDTKYFRESFQDGKGVVFYQPKKWEAVNELVGMHIGNEKRRQQLVEEGAQIVANGFTWDHRVDDFLRQAPQIYRT